MTQQCQACTRPAHAFLCGTCTAELRDMLTGLPRWLDYLADAVNGQAKLGTNDGPRAKGDDEQPMRINLRASGLAAAAHATLVAIVRTVEDSHDVQMTPLRSMQPGFVGPLLPRWRRLPAGYLITSADLALWLAHHVTALAAHEAAAEHYDDVKRIISDIERRINRPVPPRFCGPCPTVVDGHRRECGTRLKAPRDATEVRCPACKTTYSVQELNIRLINQTAYLKYKLADIYRILIEAGEDVPPRSTFYDWCAKARKATDLKVRGYERPNGRTGINRHSEADEPLFWVADVRKVLNERRAQKIR